MVYVNKRKSYGGRKSTMRKRVYRKRKSSALSVAKRALSLAKKTMMASTETKYLSAQMDTDIAGTAGLWGSATSLQLTDLSVFSPVFNTDGITGNKAYCKYIRGRWEIHMDNLNNEEETVNLTVAVVKARSDFDSLLSASDVVAVNNGIPFFNPRLVKLCYYKHWTRTMGGTSPGTAGESIAKGQFFIPVNKMFRFSTQGGTGQQTSQPSSQQDRYFFVVFTDNTAADTENPRMNAHFLTCYRDTDVNH